MLSHTLAAMQAVQFAESIVAQSTAAIEATRSAKYSLSAVIAATQGNTPLPNLDVITQNHNSWTETAKQMRVTNKLSNCPHPAEESRLTAQCIGIVKGRHRHIHNDPYAGGERSGKHMKPDVLSTPNAAPPTVESTPGMTLLGPTVPVQACMAILPPTSVLGSCLWALQSLHKWTRLCLCPPALLGLCLRALQSLCKWTCLRLCPLMLPGSHLRALYSPCFWKHLLSMLQSPHPCSSLPHT
jgi:hypothetical protein